MRFEIVILQKSLETMSGLPPHSDLDEIVLLIPCCTFLLKGLHQKDWVWEECLCYFKHIPVQ